MDYLDICKTMEQSPFGKFIIGDLDKFEPKGLKDFVDFKDSFINFMFPVTAYQYKNVCRFDGCIFNVFDNDGLYVGTVKLEVKPLNVKVFTDNKNFKQQKLMGEDFDAVFESNEKIDDLILSQSLDGCYSLQDIVKTKDGKYGIIIWSSERYKGYFNVFLDSTIDRVGYSQELEIDKKNFCLYPNNEFLDKYPKFSREDLYRSIYWSIGFTASEHLLSSIDERYFCYQSLSIKKNFFKFYKNNKFRENSKFRFIDQYGLLTGKRVVNINLFLEDGGE